MTFGSFTSRSFKEGGKDPFFLLSRGWLCLKSMSSTVKVPSVQVPVCSPDGQEVPDDRDGSGELEAATVGPPSLRVAAASQGAA